jgi:hypothetical protein
VVVKWSASVQSSSLPSSSDRIEVYKEASICSWTAASRLRAV